MKQQDIAIIIVLGIIGAVAGFFLSGMLFVTDTAMQQKVEVVQPISEEFGSVDGRYFNFESVNPAPNVVIDGQGNEKPFGSQGN